MSVHLQNSQFWLAIGGSLCCSVSIARLKTNCPLSVSMAIFTNFV